MPVVAELFGVRRAMLSVPDSAVTDTLDVTPWLDAKVAAILAHRSETARGAGPGVIARLPADDRARLLATEWYIRWELPALS